MKFLDKAVILKDVEDNDICIFVDKVAYIKELKSKTYGNRYIPGQLSFDMKDQSGGDIQSHVEL